MKTNPVRSKLKRGEPSVGTWLTLPDPVAAQLMARTGFDWLTIELEHSPTSYETAAQMFTIVAASGCVPLARIPWNTGENIKRVLDTGAWGIVVPMVNHRAEAEAIPNVTAGAGYVRQNENRSDDWMFHFSVPVPLYNRNPQKFVPNIFTAPMSEYQSATQTIYRSAKYPSHINVAIAQ